MYVFLLLIWVLLCKYCVKNSHFADLNHLSSKIYYIFQIYNNYYWKLYFARFSSSHTIAKTIICIKQLWNFFFGTEQSGYLSFLHCLEFQFYGVWKSINCWPNTFAVTLQPVQKQWSVCSLYLLNWVFMLNSEKLPKHSFGWGSARLTHIVTLLNP